MNRIQDIQGKDCKVMLQVSDRGYNSKPSQSVISRMSWHATAMSMDELSDYIAKGYSFRPFANRKDEALKTYSNALFIDVDHVELGLDTLLSTMKDVPSIAYNTFSSTKGDYGYRLVYVFGTPFRGSQQKDLFMRIVTDRDNCIPQYTEYVENGKKVRSGYDYRVCNQYYNGTDKDVYCSGIVYKLPNDLIDEQLDWSKTNIKCSKLHDYDCQCPSDIFDSEVLNAFQSLSLSEFRNKMALDFGTELQVETSYVQDNDERVYVKPEKYYRLPVRYCWDKATKQELRVQWRDGERRNEKLYIAGVLIRKIQNPDANELLYLLTDYFLRYIDNSDGRFRKKDILRYAKDAMKADLNVAMRDIKAPSYRVDDGYCYRNKVQKRQVVGQLNGERMKRLKEERWKLMEKWYNPDKTVNQNLVALRQKGVKVSERTLKTWLSERKKCK